MLEGDGKNMSSQYLQLVKDLIEYCLQLYMSQKEVIQTLQKDACIEPAFTELVWQKLEEENKEFFKAYNFSLKVKNQICMFNQLLQKQVELMNGVCSSSSVTVSLSNESNSPLQQTPCYSSSLINAGPPLLQHIRINDSAALSNGRVDLAASSQMEILQPMNGVKIEATFSGSSDFLFHSYDDFGQEISTVGQPALSSSTILGLGVQPLNELGVLAQIPQNYEFSNLAADLAQRTDLMASFGGSLFLGSELTGLSSLSGGKCEGENSVLETGSEGPSVDGFQSD
ncbi:uncharacterized protein LOC144716720 [Wolffia australiana]